MQDFSFKGSTFQDSIDLNKIFFVPRLARPGDELKVEQGVKDLRSLSLPNMKPSGSQSPYILTPGSERVEHGSLGRRENVDLLVSPRPAGRRPRCGCRFTTTVSQTRQTPKHTTPSKPHTALRHGHTLCDSYCFAAPAARLPAPRPHDASGQCGNSW